MITKQDELSQQDIVDILNNHKCFWCNLGVWETTETMRVLDKVIRQKVESRLSSQREQIASKVEELRRHGKCDCREESISCPYNQCLDDVLSIVRNFPYIKETL